MAESRVTTNIAEVLASPQGDARVTAQTAEVLIGGEDASTEVYFFATEVLVNIVLGGFEEALPRRQTAVAIAT